MKNRNNPLWAEVSAGYTLRIYPDPSPINRRSDGEPLGTLYCRHRRYELGDAGAEDAFIETTAGREVRADIFVALPVYFYDHGGITLRAGEPFSCPWDSGLVGVIYVTKSKALAEYGALSEEVHKKCASIITAEVEEHSKFLNGDVYGYEVISPSGDIVDSCWGFYGDYEAPHGALEEGRVALKRCQKHEQTEVHKCAKIMAL